MKSRPLLPVLVTADGVMYCVGEPSELSVAEVPTRAPRRFGMVWFLLGLSVVLLIVAVMTQSSMLYGGSFAAWAMSYVANWLGGQR